MNFLTDWSWRYTIGQGQVEGSRSKRLRGATIVVRRADKSLDGQLFGLYSSMEVCSVLTWRRFINWRFSNETTACCPDTVRVRR
jgi:hypothetical protein